MPAVRLEEPNQGDGHKTDRKIRHKSNGIINGYKKWYEETQKMTQEPK
jgi:hypothetical protein